MKSLISFLTNQYCDICQEDHCIDGRHWWENISSFFLGHHKCKFCKRYCNRGTFPENKADWRWWSCHKCGVTYSYHDTTNKLKTCRFVRELKGQLFMLYLDDYGTKLLVEGPDNVLGRTSPSQVLQLDYQIHDVTPANAQNKIKTLLTFS